MECRHSIKFSFQCNIYKVRVYIEYISIHEQLDVEHAGGTCPPIFSCPLFRVLGHQSPIMKFMYSSTRNDEITKNHLTYEQSKEQSSDGSCYNLGNHPNHLEIA